MTALIVIGYYTIWFTPIIFITSLIGAMKAIKDGTDHKGYTIVCVISFWLIIVPIFYVITNSY